MEAICDKCSEVLDEEEANDGMEFDYAVLCNECYGEEWNEANKE